MREIETASPVWIALSVALVACASHDSGGPRDASGDAEGDVSADGPRDASGDAEGDVSADGPRDATQDAPDAATDAQQGGTDALDEGSADSSFDGYPDAPPDALPDAGPSLPVLFALDELSAVARRSDGTVVGWGDNSNGTVGDGTNTERPAPVAVAGIANAVALGSGGTAVHQCAVMPDTTVRCWGSNYYGQLGDGTKTNRNSPVAVPGLSGVVALTEARFSTCALLSAGTVTCWGSNPMGELGNGTTTASLTPVSVPGLSGVTALAAGHETVCALLSNGGVQCWGDGSLGVLGDNNVSAHVQTTPALVASLSDAVTICLGGNYGCAARAGGGAVCWGANSSGQLGNGTTVNSPAPVEVSGLTGIVDVSCGMSTACALTQYGQVWCWGDNHYGLMGNGTSSVTPVTTPTLATISKINTSAIRIGLWFACALSNTPERADQLFCWGDNSLGELGVGKADNTGPHGTPLLVEGF
jgi:alpha-tubulin suppressor-like RCC1 family protein